MRLREKIADHVITSCPIYHHSNGTHCLSFLDDNLVSWLTCTCIPITSPPYNGEGESLYNHFHTKMLL